MISGLEVTKIIRKLECGFLFAFHGNYGSILHQFRDKARYWSKIVIFSYPLAFDAAVRGILVGILPSRLVRKKQNGGEDMYNRLRTIPACDGQIDGQTSCHVIARAMHTRRAVKTRTSHIKNSKCHYWDFSCSAHCQED